MVRKIKINSLAKFKQKICLPVFAAGCFMTSGCGSGSSSTSPTPQSGSAAVLLTSGGNFFDFGNHLVGTSVEQSFTVSNSGNATATDMSGTFHLSLNFAFKGGGFPGLGGTCSSSLIPGASCTVMVVYTPRLAGQSEVPLEINFNDGNAPKTITAPVLRGRGI